MEVPPSSGYRKVSLKLTATSLMPPIANMKSRSSSFSGKSKRGDSYLALRAPQLEDDLQLHHLVDLMKVFHVSLCIAHIKRLLYLYWNTLVIS